MFNLQIIQTAHQLQTACQMSTTDTSPLNMIDNERRMHNAANDVVLQLGGWMDVRNMTPGAASLYIIYLMLQAPSPP